MEKKMEIETRWARLKYLATQATQGKWRASPYHWGRADLDVEDPTSDRFINAVPHRKLAEDLSFDDAYFIAEASPENIRELLEQLDRKVEALAFYANPKSYEEWVDLSHPANPIRTDIEIDQGKKAREALT